jgi:IS30 family transposase
LTESEKKQIQDLRLKGVGYKAIATMLGRSRDSVKRYCKRNGLAGNAKAVVLNVEENIRQHQLCACCKKPIKQKVKGRSRKFCSEECRRKWWSENPRAKTKKETAIYHYVCPGCGIKFSCYGNRKRKYCCHDCYIKSRFRSEENGI